MRLRPLDERGLTLTEVAIVGVIGVLVLLGLGGFYLNSQATWLDAFVYFKHEEHGKGPAFARLLRDCLARERQVHSEPR